MRREGTIERQLRFWQRCRPASNYLPGVPNAAERILESAPLKVPLDRNLPRLGNFGFVFLHTAEPERVMEYYENNIEAGYFQPISTAWFRRPSATLTNPVRSPNTG